MAHYKLPRPWEREELTLCPVRGTTMIVPAARSDSGDWAAAVLDRACEGHLSDGSWESRVSAELGGADETADAVLWYTETFRGELEALAAACAKGEELEEMGRVGWSGWPPTP